MNKKNLLYPILATLAFATGCHTPSGGWMPYTGGSSTYYSTETSPKTVTIVNLTTNEEVFSLDIPAGKQLTFDFVSEAGDDEVYRPDLMRYAVWDIGTTMGKLNRSLTVPNAASRRIDVAIRSGYEYAPAEPGRELRSDEISDRADWWTPQGGEMPVNRSTVIYDG